MLKSSHPSPRTQGTGLLYGCVCMPQAERPVACMCCFIVRITSQTVTINAPQERPAIGYACLFWPPFLSPPYHDLMRWIGPSITSIALAVLACFQGLVLEARATAVAELLAMHLPSLLRSSKETTPVVELRDNEPYWLEAIAHRGTAAYNRDSSYKVFRNVKVSVAEISFTPQQQR